MNKFLKIFIPVFALVGITLLAIGQGKNIALLMLFYFMPIFLIYVLINTKNKLANINTKLKTTLFTVLIINTIFISLRLLLKIQHWPGAGLLDIVCALLSIVSLIIGLIYFLKNHNHLNSTFTYELILILFPTLMFLWRFIPFDFYGKQNTEYVQLITTSTNHLESVNKTIQDTNCTYSDKDIIKQLKQFIITTSGGLNQKGELCNFYNKSAAIVIEKKETKIRKISCNKELINQLLKCSVAGEAIFILTQIENELIITNCITE